MIRNDLGLGVCVWDVHFGVILINRPSGLGLRTATFVLGLKEGCDLGKQMILAHIALSLDCCCYSWFAWMSLMFWFFVVSPVRRMLSPLKKGKVITRYHVESAINWSSKLEKRFSWIRRPETTPGGADLSDAARG